MKNCNKCILFEGRLKRDLYMWMANIPSGPSAKFLVENGNNYFCQMNKGNSFCQNM
jgi:ribosome biogenesis protein BRX1